MNPFTEPTVARPLSDAEATWPTPAVESERASRLKPGRRAPKRHPKSASSPGVPPDSQLKRMTIGRRHPRSWLNIVLPTGRCRGIKLVSVALLGLAVPGLAGAVNVNAATQEQLETVRGIGSKTAQIIVEERSRAGPYESFEDLSDRVKGIGPKKAAIMKASGLKVETGTVDAKAKVAANR